MSRADYPAGEPLSNRSAKAQTVPSLTPTCNHPGCTKQLAQNNTIGFCREHRLDARLGSKLCKHTGCSKRLGQDNKTGYCGRHKGDAKRAPTLSDEQLKERRADDRWEDHHGEKDTVACRICGEQWADLGKGRRGKKSHLLAEHGLPGRQYQQYCESRGWGRPRVSSLKTQEGITQWRNENPEKVKALQRRKNRRDKERLATDPKFREHQHEQVRKNAQRKLSEEEKKSRVQCRICGEWYRSLGKHLRTTPGHPPPNVYKRLFPDAPVVSPNAKEKQSRHSKALWADRKAELERLRALAGGNHGQAVAPGNGTQPSVASKQKTRKDPGRKKIDPRDTVSFKVSTKVEEQLPIFQQLFNEKKTGTAKLRTRGFTHDHIDAALISQTPLIAARRYVSNTYKVKDKKGEHFLDYDTVAKYHWEHSG